MFRVYSKSNLNEETTKYESTLTQEEDANELVNFFNRVYTGILSFWYENEQTESTDDEEEIDIRNIDRYYLF